MQATRVFLDKRSPVPLYHQLSEHLRDEIKRSGAEAGDLIGTEKDIAEQYRVSRATVRQALDDLERAGWVVRITGRGTFVATPHLTVDLPNLLSFTEEMRLRGIEPGSVIHAFGLIACPDHVAVALHCHPGDRVCHIKRVRTADGTPMFVVDHYLAPFVDLPEDHLGQSLYETIEGRYGLRLTEALQTIRAGVCANDEAALLQIVEGDAVLRFERTTLSADDQPVIFESGSARADLYQYSVRLFRR